MHTTDNGTILIDSYQFEQVSVPRPKWNLNALQKMKSEIRKKDNLPLIGSWRAPQTIL